ncbi:MAG: cohesin domain-containing protein [Ruminococcus sp.]|nr:cohesin domain-containing protein [Ruminococcus sp.]
MNKKLQKKDKIILGVLAALIVIVIGAGAFLIIRNSNTANTANEKTSKTSSAASSSQISTSKATSSKSKKSSKTGSSKKSSAAKSESKSSSSSSKSASSSSNGGSTSSKTSSKSSKSSSSTSKNIEKGDKVKRVKPKENKSHASNQTLKVNEKTCYVGDKITIVMNLTSKKSIVNYQGALSFDNKYLKLKDVASNKFGVANSNGSYILYNASSLNGMDFSETGTVFTATFEVKEAGSTEVKNDLEIISELVNNNIIQLSPNDYEVKIDIYD